MLQQLIDKIGVAEREDHYSYFSRLRPLKADILRLEAMLPAEHFDGALLLNVLYTLEEPERCLREVYDLLESGGRLVLSTSHSETNVDRLFARMREVLNREGRFESLRRHYADARKRNDAMIERILRDSQADIRRYIENAGFRVVDWRPGYVDAVVVVEAVKP